MVPSFVDVLRLLRIHTGAATAMVPSLAAWVSGGDPIVVILVFLSGLSHHAWGFSLNEIMDLEVDRKAGEHLSGKPLVSGKMKIGTAWIISLLCLVLSFVFMAGAALLGGSGIVLTIILLSLSSASVLIYDTLSKKVPFMDVFVGTWFALLILAAAIASGVPGDYVWIVSLIATASGLHLFFNNMIEGGLKDARTDKETGVRSAAVTLGVRPDAKGIVLSFPFRAIAIVLRGSFVSVLMVIAYLSYDRGAHEALLIIVTVGALAIIGHSLQFLGKRVDIERTRLLKVFSVHEISSFILSIVAVSYVAGIPASVVAIVVPVAWFAIFNRTMYGRNLAPKV